MIFAVTRSSWKGKEPTYENPPCEEATLRVLENGRVCWVVELETLDQLLLFADDNEPLIVDVGDPDRSRPPYHGLPTIELYDDFREGQEQSPSKP